MRSKLHVIACLILLLPLDLIVPIGILLAQIFLSSQRRGGASRAEPPLLCEEGNVVATIVIVNFDGKHLLADCLPALTGAVRHASRQHEVLVVDNGSADVTD